MLKNETSRRGSAQGKKYNYASECPSRDNHGLSFELVCIPKLFPVTSDYIGGNSAIATGQISRANQSVSNKAAFRKMFRFAFVGKKTGVSGRGWSSPSAHNLLSGFQGERVLGVNALDGTPVESGKSKDVVNDNFRSGNFYAWVPEKQPGEKAKPNVNPDFGQQNSDGFSGKRNSSNGSKNHSQYGHDFARAGSKPFGIHSVSFAQSAVEVGAGI